MTLDSDEKIGLVAGAGDIPLYYARKARAQGLQLVSIGFTDEISDRLRPHVEKTYSIGLSKVGKMIKAFQEEKIRDVLIMGKVEKEMIFKPQMFDLETLKVLMSLRTHQDKTVLIRVIDELKKRGFNVLDQRECMKELYPAKGVLTRAAPSSKEMEDVEFGIPIAKYMADQEIGQTIVVKNKSVIAVEGVEGTDRALQRGCELSQGKCTAIKVSRTDQDYRFDSPGIGPQTIQKLIDGKASVLALEAERVMVINRETVVDMADRAGLAVVCV